MRTLMQTWLERQQQQKTTIFCRLVETHGSTPQKAGAGMLIFPEGGQFGTLGGGCVEAEVQSKALQLQPGQPPEILSFSLNHDYGWDDGLICGGVMKILLDPGGTSDANRYFSTQARLLAEGTGFTEVCITNEQEAGSDSQNRFLVLENGRLEAIRFDRPVDIKPELDFNLETVEKLRAALRPLSERPRPYHQEGFAFLPSLPRCRLIIIGAGHIGQAVAGWATELDFEVWVVDDRASYCSEERFPKIEKLVVGPFEEILPQLPIDQSTYCLIVTRGHNHDEEALFHLIQQNACYLGMIGSKRKIRLIFDDLRGEGITDEQLERVHAPVGLEIGSQTVPEIAISILAEIVAHRNCQGKIPGKSLSSLER
ncbi:Xanthine dehydrogenase accessory factor [Planctomycetales bacterium 10988]|nr:Xanthine dehydrogenase accessory factor [Planctomycetales bacterium 10988]